MLKSISDYIDSLCRDIPENVILVGASFFCLGAVMIMITNNLRKSSGVLIANLKGVSFLALIEYIFLLVGLTVFLREIPEKFSGCDLRPFWSYRAYFRGDNPELLVENFMNMVMFVPIGLLIGFTVQNVRWWMVLLIGTSISSLIEILQFYTKLGFSELDDVIHNTVGCMIGYGICMAIDRTRKWIARR